MVETFKIDPIQPDHEAHGATTRAQDEVHAMRAQPAVATSDDVRAQPAVATPNDQFNKSDIIDARVVVGVGIGVPGMVAPFYPPPVPYGAAPYAPPQRGCPVQRQDFNPVTGQPEYIMQGRDYHGRPVLVPRTHTELIPC